MSACERSSCIWPSTNLLLEYVPYMHYLIQIRGGVRPVHTFYNFRPHCTHWPPKPCMGVFVEKYKVLVHRTRKRVHKCLNDLISIVEAGQVPIYDDIQVSRTLIGHPALTSNDAPQNLLCFWAQQSLNRSFYLYTCPLPLLKEKVGFISKHYPSMFTKSVNFFKILLHNSGP